MLEIYKEVLEDAITKWIEETKINNPQLELRKIKTTAKGIRNVFELIADSPEDPENYGYSEIHVQTFRKTSRTRYDFALKWLEKRNFIKIRKNSKTGHQSWSGLQYFYTFSKNENKFVITSEIKTKPFARGFKVHDDLKEYAKSMGINVSSDFSPEDWKKFFEKESKDSEYLSKLYRLAEIFSKQLTDDKNFSNADENKIKELITYDVEKIIRKNSITKLTKLEKQVNKELNIEKKPVKRLNKKILQVKTRLNTEELDTYNKIVETLVKNSEKKIIDKIRSNLAKTVDKIFILDKELVKPLNKIVDWKFETSWNKLTLDKSLALEMLTPNQINKLSNQLKLSYHYSEGRYYGAFHSMPKETIQFLRLDNEEIEEWGDGTAFFMKLIGKHIEDVDYISHSELVKFQTFVINDPYTTLMKEVGFSSRKEAKLQLNIYVNCVFKRANRNLTMIDNYFINHFPKVRKWLIEIPTYTKITSEGKKKKVKSLWKLNQNLEEKIMKSLSEYLHSKYDVYPITKHDAIYFNKSDINILRENNVDFEKELLFELRYTSQMSREQIALFEL